jgi:hypothetical protein
MAYSTKKDAAQDGKNAVAEPCSAYNYMIPKWEMMEALLGGTATMRQCPEYLPQHSAEDIKDYDARLANTTLYNVTELTLNSLVGRVFREPITLNDDIPSQIIDIAENIDAQGTDISTFCSQWFRESMAKGFAHVFIDMPSISDEEKKTRTKADDLKENRRPFWSLLKPENVIFMYWEKSGGIEKLAHVRIVECEVTLDGFVETYRTRIRVLTPGTWALWENKNEGKKGRKPQWEEVESGTYDIDEIPIVTFYTDKRGPMMAKPPLEDLAYLNIRHWQSTSDQMNVLTVARFPMLAASGTAVESGKSSMPIGPRQLLTMRDPNGRFYYVEHTGRAITAGKEDIEGLEDRMSAYGAEFLRRQISGRTAFERNMDTNEAISPLKAMATLFESAVRQALEITAEWLSIDEGGTVKVNKEYTETEDKASPMQILGEARKRGDISVETWITEAIRHHILDDTIDVKAEIGRLKSEAKEGPHPPTYYAAQLQVQGKLAEDGEVTTDEGDQKVLPKGKKAKPAAANAPV